MIELKFQVQGAKEVRRVLTRIDMNAKDLTPAFEEVGENILKSIRQNFQKEGRPTRWAPLAPRTQKERIKQGYGAEHPILQRTRTLIQSASEKSGIGNWFEAKRDGIIIKCLIRYGAELHFGRANMPARPFFFLQPEDMKMTYKTIQKHFFSKGE